MDGKIMGTLKNSQSSILEAFQIKFNEITRENTELKFLLTEEQKALRTTKQFMQLEESREWYKNELIKLEKQLKETESNYKKLIIAYEDAIADKKLLYSKFVELKKENKLLYNSGEKNMQKSNNSPKLDLYNIDFLSDIMHEVFARIAQEIIMKM